MAGGGGMAFRLSVDICFQCSSSATCMSFAATSVSLDVVLATRVSVSPGCRDKVRRCSAILLIVRVLGGYVGWGVLELGVEHSRDHALEGLSADLLGYRVIKTVHVE